MTKKEEPYPRAAVGHGREHPKMVCTVHEDDLLPLMKLLNEYREGAIYTIVAPTFRLVLTNVEGGGLLVEVERR